MQVQSSPLTAEFLLKLVRSAIKSHDQYREQSLSLFCYLDQIDWSLIDVDETFGILFDIFLSTHKLPFPEKIF